jgi:hypothetical protein
LGCAVSDEKRRRRKLSKITVAGEIFEVYAPGFRPIQRKGLQYPTPYWIASKDAVAKGYPTKTVPIPVGLGPGNMPPADVAKAIEEECQKQQAAMLAWLDGETDDKARLAPKFNGSIASLIDCYESDAYSAYQYVQDNTADGYKPWLKMVRQTVGARSIYRVVPIEFRGWHDNWKKISQGKGTDGSRQAYGGIQMLRVILNYGTERGIQRCLQLRMAMDNMKFPKGPPRNVIMTYRQVRAFIGEAWSRRELFMALVQALQFEAMFRQNDVIGKWKLIKSDYRPAPGDIVVGDRYWRGLRMEMLRLDNPLVVTTSKTKKPVVHALASCELVVECLEKIGDASDGPVARQANGQPWRDRQQFSKAWREIAKAAGIPAKVWNMDTRASGITEAAEAGVSDDDIVKQTAHADKRILRDVYKRAGEEASKRSHEKRQESRKATQANSKV